MQLQREYTLTRVNPASFLEVMEQVLCYFTSNEGLSITD